MITAKKRSDPASHSDCRATYAPDFLSLRLQRATHTPAGILLKKALPFRRLRTTGSTKTSPRKKIIEEGFAIPSASHNGVVPVIPLRLPLSSFQAPFGRTVPSSAMFAPGSTTSAPVISLHLPLSSFQAPLGRAVQSSGYVRSSLLSGRRRPPLRLPLDTPTSFTLSLTAPSSHIASDSTSFLPLPPWSLPLDTPRPSLSPSLRLPLTSLQTPLHSFLSMEKDQSRRLRQGPHHPPLLDPHSIHIGFICFCF